MKSSEMIYPECLKELDGIYIWSGDYSRDNKLRAILDRGVAQGLINLKDTKTDQQSGFIIECIKDYDSNEAEELLMMFIDDVYHMKTSRSSIKTVRAMSKFVNSDKVLQQHVNNSDSKAILKHRLT